MERDKQLPRKGFSLRIWDILNLVFLVDATALIWDPFQSFDKMYKHHKDLMEKRPNLIDSYIVYFYTRDILLAIMHHVIRYVVMRFSTKVKVLKSYRSYLVTVVPALPLISKEAKNELQFVFKMSMGVLALLLMVSTML